MTTFTNHFNNSTSAIPSPMSVSLNGTTLFPAAAIVERRKFFVRRQNCSEGEVLVNKNILDCNPPIIMLISLNRELNMDHQRL